MAFLFGGVSRLEVVPERGAARKAHDTFVIPKGYAKAAAEPCPMPGSSGRRVNHFVVVSVRAF
jgi:hypothetical protein